MLTLPSIGNRDAFVLFIRIDEEKLFHCFRNFNCHKFSLRREMKKFRHCFVQPPRDSINTTTQCCSQLLVAVCSRLAFLLYLSYTIDFDWLDNATEIKDIFWFFVNAHDSYYLVSLDVFSSDEIQITKLLIFSMFCSTTTIPHVCEWHQSRVRFPYSNKFWILYTYLMSTIDWFIDLSSSYLWWIPYTIASLKICIHLLFALWLDYFYPLCWWV